MELELNLVQYLNKWTEAFTWEVQATPTKTSHIIIIDFTDI